MKYSKLIKRLWLACFSATALAAQLFIWPYFKVEKMLEIQFLCNPEAFSHLVGNQATVLRHNLMLDFGFIACYTLLFYYSIKLMGHLLKLTRLHYTWLCLLPGVLDIAENILTLNMLHGCTCPCCFWPFFYTVRLKWLLVLPFALLALMMGTYLLLEYLDKRSCRKG